MPDVAVRNALQQVSDAVQARSLLVDGLDDPPGRLGNVRALEHGFLGLRILLPAGTGLEVHGGKLPLLQRVVDAHLEAKMLLLVGDREPVLEEHDARTDEHALELGNRVEEFLVLGLGAEAHYPFDAGAVVPAAVEEDHLAACGQVGDVALKVPLGTLALVRRGQRRHAADARVEALRDPLDDSSLARGIAPLEDHHELELLVDDPVLELHELSLQAEELAEVELPIDRRLPGRLGYLSDELGQARVVHLELELLVEAVEHLSVNPFRERAARLLDAHGRDFSAASRVEVDIDMTTSDRATIVNAVRRSINNRCKFVTAPWRPAMPPSQPTP